MEKYFVGRRRKLWWFFVLIALFAGAALAQAPPACDGPLHSQFDFWIGEWKVETPDGKFAGRNTVTKTLNNCVVEENWRGAGGSIGRSFNMYFRGDGKWHQTWVDGSGGRLDLEGGLQDGDMVLSGKSLGKDGQSVRQEIRFTPEKDGSVKQHWRSSRDGGKTWSDVFVGIYRRADPE